MKLWLLLPNTKDLPPSRDPWSANNYDVAVGFVVRAKTEDEARVLASDQRGDEQRNSWLDPNLSTCTPLTAKGKSEVILRDFNAA